MTIRWHELEFRHLEYAIALKNHQAFTAAARALNLDQGLFSRQIKYLETTLGFRLFERRPVRMTAAGQVFLTQAEQIVKQAKQAVELAHDTQAGKHGRLDIGINTSIANCMLPDILRRFCQQFPNVNLVLHELPSYIQIEQLKKHQIAVGFFHQHNLQSLGKKENETLVATPVIREPLVAVLPESHCFAKQTSVSLSKLSGENFILPTYALLPGLREQTDEFLAAANCHPVVVQESAWITTALSLVAGGMGVSLLPANVKQLQRTGVVYRDIQESSPVLEIVAVSQVENNSSVLKHFLRVVEELSAISA